MTNDKIIEKRIEDFIFSYLHHQFGGSPQTVNVAVRHPFVVIHLTGFILPGEKNFLKRNEIKRVAQTRDLLLKGVKIEFSHELAKITGFDVKELYTDWNFEKESGLLIVIMEAETDAASVIFPEEVDKIALHDTISLMSKQTEKVPETIRSYWLNDSIVLVERFGIIVDIEKELIKNGAVEELRLAKRPLEHRVIELLQLESVLKQEISEFFVDWNFEEDKSYMVFILESKSK